MVHYQHEHPVLTLNEVLNFVKFVEASNGLIQLFSNTIHDFKFH